MSGNLTHNVSGICIDCMCNCKPNYHTITTATGPKYMFTQHCKYIVNHKLKHSDISFRVENNKATTAINSKFVHNVSALFACKECCNLMTHVTHCRPVLGASLYLIRPAHLVDDSFGGFEESMLYFHNKGFRLFGENHYIIAGLKIITTVDWFMKKTYSRVLLGHITGCN